MESKLERDIKAESADKSLAPSYTAMIAKAIMKAPYNKATLAEIYDHMDKEFDLMQSRGSGWRNCVRHTLSLNECFVKLYRPQNGRSCNWTIHPSYFGAFFNGDYRKKRVNKKKTQWMDNFQYNNQPLPYTKESTCVQEHETQQDLPPPLWEAGYMEHQYKHKNCNQRHNSNPLNSNETTNARSPQFTLKNSTKYTDYRVDEVTGIPKCVEHYIAVINTAPKCAGNQVDLGYRVKGSYPYYSSPNSTQYQKQNPYQASYYTNADSFLPQNVVTYEGSSASKQHDLTTPLTSNQIKTNHERIYHNTDVYSSYELDRIRILESQHKV